MKKVIPFNGKPDNGSSGTAAAPQQASAAVADRASWHDSTEQQLLLLQRLIGCSREHELLERFFRWSADLALADGMSFTPPNAGEVVHLGERKHHSAQYELTLNGINVGSIALCRRQRFSENELLLIEQSLSALARCLLVANEVSTLQQLATKDPLTGLGNRNSMDHWLKTELSRTRRHKTPLSVLMIDIDNFKPLNDSLGHLAGDRILKAIADVFKRSTRSSDLLFRFGGDEFAILLPHTDLPGAVKAATQIRNNLARLTAVELGVEDSSGLLRPDVSIGIAACHPGDDEISLLQRADTHLYHAKAAGRGRICSSL